MSLNSDASESDDEFLNISIQKESIVPPNMFYLFKISSFVGLRKQVLVKYLCQRMKLQTRCKEEYNKGVASNIYLFWTVRSKYSTNNLFFWAPACSGISDIWKSNHRRKCQFGILLCSWCHFLFLYKTNYCRIIRLKELHLSHVLEFSIMFRKQVL